MEGDFNQEWKVIIKIDVVAIAAISEKGRGCMDIYVLHKHTYMFI